MLGGSHNHLSNHGAGLCSKTPTCALDHRPVRQNARSQSPTNGASGSGSGSVRDPGSDRGRGRTRSRIRGRIRGRIRIRNRGRNRYRTRGKGRPNGTCRVRNCAPTTNRPCDAYRTIALPGTPREARSGTALPAQLEAAGARAAWSQTFPLPLTTTLLVRRWDAGPSRRPRRPRMRAGHNRNRDRGSVCRWGVYALPQSR